MALKTSMIRELLHRLENLAESDEDQFDEIPGWDGESIEHLTNSAALLPIGPVEKVWFPLKMLRVIGSNIYASKWILGEKGLA